MRSLCFEYKKKRTKLLHQCFQLFHPSYSLLTFCQDTLRFLLRASYHRKLPQEVSIATQWQKCTGTSRIGTGRNSRTNRVSRLQIVLHSTPTTGRETNTVLSLASSKFPHFANADRTSPPLYFIPRMDDGHGLSGIIPGIRWNRETFRNDSGYVMRAIIRFVWIDSRKPRAERTSERTNAFMETSVFQIFFITNTDSMVRKPLRKN